LHHVSFLSCVLGQTKTSEAKPKKVGRSKGLTRDEIQAVRENVEERERQLEVSITSWYKIKRTDIKMTDSNHSHSPQQLLSECSTSVTKLNLSLLLDTCV